MVVNMRDIEPIPFSLIKPAARECSGRSGGTADSAAQLGGGLGSLGLTQESPAAGSNRCVEMILDGTRPGNPLPADSAITPDLASLSQQENVLG